MRGESSPATHSVFIWKHRADCPRPASTAKGIDSPSGNGIPFPAAILGCVFRSKLNRKPHPVLSIKSGTQFPSSTPSGKRIPLCTGFPRWTFRQGLQPESLSRNPRPKWDALSLQIACGRRIPEFAEERHMLSRLAYQTAPEHTLRQQQRKKGARANADALV